MTEHEISQMIQTFKKILPNYEPKLAVIIVKKRGNARFFQQDGRNILNPSPGTIIDTTVTHVNISSDRFINEEKENEILCRLFLFLAGLVRFLFDFSMYTTRNSITNTLQVCIVKSCEFYFRD